MQTQQPYPLEIQKIHNDPMMILWIHIWSYDHPKQPLRLLQLGHEAAKSWDFGSTARRGFWQHLHPRRWRGREGNEKLSIEMTICKKSSTLCTKSIKSTKSTHHFPKVKLCLLISGLFRSCVFMLEASTFPKMVHPQRRPPAVVTSSFALLCCAPENPGNAWTTPGAHRMPEAL